MLDKRCMLRGLCFAGGISCFKTVPFLSTGGAGEFSGTGCMECPEKLPELRFELCVTVWADICGIAVIIFGQKYRRNAGDNKRRDDWQPVLCFDTIYRSCYLKNFQHGCCYEHVFPYTPQRLFILQYCHTILQMQSSLYAACLPLGMIIFGFLADCFPLSYSMIFSGAALIVLAAAVRKN